MGRELSLRDAAAILGVHYMTAYRYIRLGHLRAQKVSSRWLVDEQDLAEFMAGRRSLVSVGSNADPSVQRSVGASPVALWAGRYEDRLVAGDRVGCWSLIELALSSGHGVETIYLQVVQPAMYAIGERWDRGEIGIDVEHLASTIVGEHLGRLSPRFARRGPSRGTVVLGCAPGERHSIGLALLADLLRAQGFEVRDLGADVPVEAFESAVRATTIVDRLLALGIGCTVSGSGDEELQQVVASVRRVAPSLAVVVGGQAMDTKRASSLGADAFAAGAADFVDLLLQWDSSGRDPGEALFAARAG